jgi:hypothetical protein
MKNKHHSGYSNHILHTGHACGSVTDAMKVVKMRKREKYLNTIQKYHVYELGKSGLHMNDAFCDVYSPTSEALQELNSRELHTNTHYETKNQSSLASRHNKPTQQEKKTRDHGVKYK